MTRNEEVNVASQIDAIKTELRKLGNKKRAKILQGFFKTGPGEYGEGDIFFGVKVPDLRRLSKKHDLPITGIHRLLKSPIHEERLLALLMLVRAYAKADGESVGSETPLMQHGHPILFATTLQIRFPLIDSHQEAGHTIGQLVIDGR